MIQFTKINELFEEILAKAGLLDEEKKTVYIRLNNAIATKVITQLAIQLTPEQQAELDKKVTDVESIGKILAEYVSKEELAVALTDATHVVLKNFLDEIEK